MHQPNSQKWSHKWSLLKILQLNQRHFKNRGCSSFAAVGYFHFIVHWLGRRRHSRGSRFLASLDKSARQSTDETESLASLSPSSSTLSHFSIRSESRFLSLSTISLFKFWVNVTSGSIYYDCICFLNSIISAPMLSVLMVPFWPPPPQTCYSHLHCLKRARIEPA